ncbi:hypothetical protein [Acinetobacter pittii]|uniref:hypothetical protein n=1 Tax=Acinetobacter pittii TaxID=48296 RepID=UPI00300D38CD
MIDLNQELEDFDAYFFKRHGELPLDPTSEEYANKSYLKHEMFKAWKARAKAQTVPEGYVLMPKVPSEKMFQAYERYSVAPMSTLSKTGYKAMVEAAGDQNENS